MHDAFIPTNDMASHDWLAPLIPAFETLALVIDLIGIAIILYGFVRALFQFVTTEIRSFKTRTGQAECQSIRLTLGTYILLGIEFMIASDIIHTVLSRELGDLIFVAALVAIRTAISYFLGKELEEVRRDGSS